jgi:hypothetical protein
VISSKLSCFACCTEPTFFCSVYTRNIELAILSEDISSYRISAHAIKVANCPKDGGNERYQNENPKTSIRSRKEQEAITSDKRKKNPQ